MGDHIWEICNDIHISLSLYIYRKYYVWEIFGDNIGMDWDDLGKNLVRILGSSWDDIGKSIKEIIYGDNVGRILGYGIIQEE